jgi:hypothetical protein
MDINYNIMECGICKSKLTGKAKKICSNCNAVKHKLQCINCNEIQYVTAHYYVRIDANNNVCKRCVNKSLIGSKNPNYGKKWSEEQRKKQSELIKSKVDDNYRADCAKGMNGKIVDETVKLKRRNTLIKKYGSLKTMTTHTEESKKLIGEKSAKKFTNEYKKRLRILNEERGNYIKLNEKNDYLFYRDVSNWDGLILSNDIIGIEKLKQNSFYSKDNRNRDALVRDHMYSRRCGFDNGVFPEIIKHPANCQIISHSDNIKKSKSNWDCIITLDELIDRIINWKAVYIDHIECILFIQKYLKGERYNKENYIKNYYKL